MIMKYKNKEDDNKYIDSILELLGSENHKDWRLAIVTAKELGLVKKVWPKLTGEKIYRFLNYQYRGQAAGMETLCDVAATYFVRTVKTLGIYYDFCVVNRFQWLVILVVFEHNGIDKQMFFDNSPIIESTLRRNQPVKNQVNDNKPKQ